ncbi:unnamed protein product [Adineta steineri]|uniref:Uncharacterized protein n=1 Tax=Adineta steineri TaxID=433720 RepID=A0A815LC92_9BILA|nr:unnamed protein product [Adineta steineri]
MSLDEQKSDESLLSSYRISNRLAQSKLFVSAEHRQTKKVYRTEIDQDTIGKITQGICDKCEQLFDLLQELIDNEGKTNMASLELTDDETKLLFNVTLTIVFGRTSREFPMKLELENVELDDITRLESIIHEQAQQIEQLEWSPHDRFDRASKLPSLVKQDFHFRNVSSSELAALSDNDRTMRCPTFKHHQEHQHYSHNSSFSIATSTQTLETSTGTKAIVTTNQGFLPKSKRYQLLRFDVHLSGPINEKDIFLIGLIDEPDTKQWETFQCSTGTWAFNVCNGSIQYPSGDTRPYTCSLKRLERIRHVDLLFDTQYHRLAFRIDDYTEDHWAFCLPKQLQINQLYPFIYLHSMNMSISIAQ